MSQSRLPQARLPQTGGTSAMLPVFYTVTRVTKETDDTFTLSIDAESRGGFSFAPGQFNMVYAFGAGEVPISISGDPAVLGELWHTIRAVGPVTQTLKGLTRGDELGIRGPFGSVWPVEQAEGKDLVIVAGGIGLAPLRPVIAHVLGNRERYGQLAVAYGARSPSELLFRKDLARWLARTDVQLSVIVDRGDPGWTGHTGVVTACLEGLEFDRQGVLALVCGPEVMMRFAARELMHLGVSPNNIYLSAERNMKCAIGLCGHCQLGPAFVCKDGPIFRYDVLRPLMAVREL